jgi:hypothetical protein
MKTFDVEFYVPSKVYVTVDAEDKDKALEMAKTVLNEKLDNGVTINSDDVQKFEIEVDNIVQTDEFPDKK